MTNIFEKEKIRLLVLDDKFGRINSHWSFSTTKLKIISRIYYDEIGYEKRVMDVLINVEIDAIGLSGRNASEAIHRLPVYLKQISEKMLAIYNSIPKLMKLHNTNLSEQYNNYNMEEYEKIKHQGNDWARMAFNHPFHILLVQTYGDAKIINKINGNKSAIWAPYSYNDRLFFDRNEKKDIDIGVYFKLARHHHRIEFVKELEKIARKRGYSFEFSDKYWGEEYAKKISRAKVVVHLSYCGDIPWRLYECAASGTCFLTDPLKFNIEQLFGKNCYVEYNRDFSDLEFKLDYIFGNDLFRKSVINDAQKTVQKYAWSQYADNWLVPEINKVYREVLEAGDEVYKS